MKNEDILSLLDELPLFITLKLKRSIQQDQDQTARMLSPTASPAENINESSSSGRTSPNIINDKVEHIKLMNTFNRLKIIIYIFLRFRLGIIYTRFICQVSSRNVLCLMI